MVFSLNQVVSGSLKTSSLTYLAIDAGFSADTSGLLLELLRRIVFIHNVGS